MANDSLESYETQFKDGLHSLRDCFEKCRSKDALELFEADMRNIADEYKKLYETHNQFQIAFKCTKNHFEDEENINDNFKQIHGRFMEEHANANAGMTTSLVDDILGFTKPQVDEDMDESVVCSQAAGFTIPLDPITKKPIKDAYKNPVCGHVYERETIQNYIKSKKGGRCPCPGWACTNKDMREDNLELDFTLSQRINQAVFTSTQLEESVQSIGD